MEQRACTLGAGVFHSPVCLAEKARAGDEAVDFTPDQYFSLDWALNSYLSKWPEFGNTFSERKDLAAAAGRRIAISIRIRRSANRPHTERCFWSVSLTRLPLRPTSLSPRV